MYVSFIYNPAVHAAFNKPIQNSSRRINPAQAYCLVPLKLNKTDSECVSLLILIYKLDSKIQNIMNDKTICHKYPQLCLNLLLYFK